ncbi:MAG: hypothetical protein ABGZ53_28575 [Fuerstiella sp.]
MVRLTLLVISLLFVATHSARGGDLKLDIHSGNIISLELDISGPSLPERGTITHRMEEGIIDAGGATCWFVISDASDKDFADEFGAIRAAALDDAPDSSVNWVYFDENTDLWHFPHDAGLTSRFVGGDPMPPMANREYSPIKRFLYQGEIVTANMPLVVWGEDAGQSLLIDEGSCDPLVRSNPPSPFFVGGGPSNNGVDCAFEYPLERYKGGQAIAIDLDAGTVTMKLHKATFAPSKIPYYTVFEASKAPPAGYMGVPWAPKLANLGRFADGTGTGLIVQFGNGVPVNNGGPNRFQPGITSYRGGQNKTYSPMWVIWWAYFTNDTPIEEMFRTDRNVGEGAIPMPGSGISGFDPSVPAEFDPFQIEHKGENLTAYAISVTGNDDGFVYSLGDLFDLADDGNILLTEGPGGLRLNNALQPSLIVNCPVPITVPITVP